LIVPFYDVLNPLGGWVDDDDAMPPIGDEETPVPMDLQPVRLPVVLHDNMELTFRVHTKNPSEDQIDAIQVTQPIEGRSL
jgi:hypothetical protein